MSNLQHIRPNVPKASITIKGIDYPMAFNLNMCAELEEHYGTVDNALESLEKDGSIKNVRTVLYCTLVGSEEYVDGDLPPITEKQLGASIKLSELGNLLNTLMTGISSVVINPDDPEVKAILQELDSNGKK